MSSENTAPHCVLRALSGVLEGKDFNPILFSGLGIISAMSVAPRSGRGTLPVFDIFKGTTVESLMCGYPLPASSSKNYMIIFKSDTKHSG